VRQHRPRLQMVTPVPSACWHMPGMIVHCRFVVQPRFPGSQQGSHVRVVLQQTSPAGQPAWPLLQQAPAAMHKFPQTWASGQQRFAPVPPFATQVWLAGQPIVLLVQHSVDVRHSPPQHPGESFGQVPGTLLVQHTSTETHCPPQHFCPEGQQMPPQHCSGSAQPVPGPPSPSLL
jgi:hypothetical protein